MDARPPGDEQLDPTISMPRVVAPPPRPPAETVPAPPPRAPVVPPVVEVTTAPPPVRPQYVFGNPIAYVLARFFAFVFDVLTVALVVTEFAYALIAINPLTGLPTNSETGFDATVGMGIAVALLYVWLAEAFVGTTLWKLAFGLHVYAVHGRFVGLGRALIRNLLRPIDLLVIGGVLALLPCHRRLGDLLAGTIVARSPLRGFAPLVGWIGIIVLLGLPLLTVGWERSLATVIAVGEFVPRLIVHLWHAGLALLPVQR
jgi:uncharacterized RDD family membrane protein YckC